LSKFETGTVKNSYGSVTLLPVCLPAALPICLAVLPPVCLSVILFIRLLICPACWQSLVCSYNSVTVPPTCLASCCPVYLPSCLYVFLSRRMFVCLLACPSVYWSVCLSDGLSSATIILLQSLQPVLSVAVLPTCMYACHFAFLSFSHAACLSVCHPSFY
jgi:hypothetical protein